MKRLSFMHGLLALQLVAFWPVWRWYLARLTDSSDEPWGIIALITAIVFVLWKSGGRFAKISPTSWGVVLSCLFTSLYIVGYASLPPLGRAALAVLSIGCTVSSLALGSSAHLGILGLLILSLPIIASLQFFLGYPVRLVTAHLAAQILTFFGTPVVAEGTALNWLSELVSVDAPCAGIKMLWSGLYVNFSLACMSNLGALATWLTYTVAVFTIFIGNLLRAIVLFYGESGIVEYPEWAHSAIGLILFVAIVVVISSVNSRMKLRQEQRRWVCAG